MITPRPSLPEQFTRAANQGRDPSSRLGVEDVQRAFEEAWVEKSRTVAPGQERYRSVAGGSLQYWREVLQEAYGRLGLEMAEEEAERVYLKLCQPASWCVFEEVPETLATLKAKGLALAVASNWDRRLPELLEGLQLKPYFDFMGVSEIIGHEKPSASFFRAVVQGLGVPMDQAIHVGDRTYEDVDGARQAGLRAFLIDRNRRQPPGPSVLRSLAELPDRIL